MIFFDQIYFRLANSSSILPSKKGFCPSVCGLITPELLDRFGSTFLLASYWSGDGLSPKNSESGTRFSGNPESLDFVPKKFMK